MPGIVPWFFCAQKWGKNGGVRPLLSYSLSLKMGFPPEKVIVNAFKKGINYARDQFILKSGLGRKVLLRLTGTGIVKIPSSEGRGCSPIWKICGLLIMKRQLTRTGLMLTCEALVVVHCLDHPTALPGMARIYCGTYPLN